MSRDITGTNTQGSRSGPRADQTPGGAVDPQELVLDLADGAAVFADADADEQEPEGDVDVLGAAVKGDDERAVDKAEAPAHVHPSPSRTL